jgi:hypothetical protein
MYLMVPLPNREDSPCQSHRCGLGDQNQSKCFRQDVTVDDALRVQIIDDANHDREHSAIAKLWNGAIWKREREASQGRTNYLDNVRILNLEPGGARTLLPPEASSDWQSFVHISRCGASETRHVKHDKQTESSAPRRDANQSRHQSKVAEGVRESPRLPAGGEAGTGSWERSARPEQ